jgi:FkbH-like protein
LKLDLAPAEILRKRTAIRRELAGQPGLLPVRIAILGGSTTAEVRSILELFLLADGIAPSFYESGYNRYYDDVAFENPELWEFRPEIVYFHTTWHNLSRLPAVLEPENATAELAESELARYRMLWDKVHNGLGSLIIQNNFDMPRLRPLGNLDASQSYGSLNFLAKMNAAFAQYAASHSRFLINDIHYLSAQVGLAEWHDNSYWYQYHMAVSPFGTVALARNLSAMIRSIYGKARKCLVLDLDNTLWGGVIGDDGMQNLILGRDHPAGEAYLRFQHYVKGLRQRGILLAVCSKNEMENARQGFSHPDTVLKLEDFSAFQANWDPKPDNIRKIAAELNIGLDSLVFVDDNPAERALVAAQLPDVAVPNAGDDVSLYPEILERGGYFEPVGIVGEDLERNAYYSGNAQRTSQESRFQSYDEFLESLAMTAEIAPFAPVYLERITQLINKSNQFNLTTRRYTSAEVQSISNDPGYLTLYGRLADTFGDNGLVSVIIGSLAADVLTLDLWLMSCRVLKREMECAMFDTLIEECRYRAVTKVIGIYIPSKKNAMVAGHFENLGFTRAGDGPDGRTLWEYEVPASYTARARFIGRTGRALAAQA